jgi:hypothetical protein
MWYSHQMKDDNLTKWKVEIRPTIERGSFHCFASYTSNPSPVAFSGYLLKLYYYIWVVQRKWMYLFKIFFLWKVRRHLDLNYGVHVTNLNLKPYIRIIDPKKQDVFLSYHLRWSYCDFTGTVRIRNKIIKLWKPEILTLIGLSSFN